MFILSFMLIIIVNWSFNHYFWKIDDHVSQEKKDHHKLWYSDYMMCCWFLLNLILPHFEGDCERELQLPVTPMCNRLTTTTAKIQAGEFYLKI